MCVYNYLIAMGGDAHEHAWQKAVLLHCLWVEGQQIFYTLPETRPLILGLREPPEGQKTPTALDEYDVALAVLGSYFAATSNERKPLKEAVIEYLGIYRCTPHTATGEKPAFLLHGRRPRTKLAIVGGPSRDFFSNPARSLASCESIWPSTNGSPKHTQTRQEVKVSQFKPGEKVCIKLPAHVPKGRTSYSASKK
ncbi:unnamed protein product, partial [Ixodes pacificus]